ncbi:MAG: hypothetical protein JJ974_12165 [Phycisphaerales bacterium]|nr:hypothetical protein [Phycisphaerales bacterium]
MPAPNRNERNADAENSSTEGSGQSELETENADSTATDNTESVEATGGEEVIDLRDDMVLPDPAEVTSSESGSEESSAESPIEIQNTPPVTKPETRIIPEKSGSQSASNSPATISISSLEALEASFINARSMPREQLDEALPELLAEFTRAREAVGDDESEARPLDQRIEWLNIRLKTRDQRRAIAAALASADEQSVELNRKMDQWNNSRVYALVGRLMLSGVYTGEHLPLLYRVRAPDPVTGFDRTIGYIAPRDGQDLRPYLGRVIGVIGDPVRDEQLALTVISPTKIDQMPGQ